MRTARAAREKALGRCASPSGPSSSPRSRWASRCCARNSTGYVVIFSGALAHRAVAEPAGVPGARAATSRSTSLARLVATLVAIPARVRAYREERTRSRLRQSLNDALLAFFQGRYASAEKSAAAALIGDETKGVAAIIAARSAHELGRFNEREQFLDQAKGSRARGGPGAPHHARRPAGLAGAPRGGARGAEGPLGARRAQPAAAAPEAAGRAGAAPLGRGARHRGRARASWAASGPAEAATARRAAHLGNLEPQGAGRGRARRLLEAAARRDAHRPDRRGDRGALPPRARRHRARRRRSSSRRSSASGTRAWSRSTARPRAPTRCRRSSARRSGCARTRATRRCCWRSASCACARALWGKAQSYIEASLALEPTHDGHMTLAALMERIGKPQEAVLHFRRSAELAGLGRTAPTRRRKTHARILRPATCTPLPAGRARRRARAARARDARRPGVLGDDRPARRRRPPPPRPDEPIDAARTRR